MPAAETSEPIAIVGMALRFPAGIDGPESFWATLVEGRSAVADLPEGRWDAYPAPGPAAARAVRRAAYLRDAAGFDAEFFGITPREATQMDPQQRLILEVAWEALENAGIPPTSLAGGSAGVIMGVAGSEYGQLLLGDPARIGPWSSIGGSYSAVANRVSYVLDLHGPSFAVDGACSASLTAVHLARQALLNGESDLVLAGGVNVIAAPAHTLSLGDSGALATDGRSKPFSAAADGYGRGEGAGVIVLRRLADARRDGNRVFAVIRASGVRHDGRTAGIMAPNAAAQTELLRGLYADAGIDPATIDYLEAHATGTSLGDPTEAAAAAAVFGRESGDPLLIGSVKGNVGHLEAVAGVAGMIKTTLAMQHRLIPETVGPQVGVNPAVLAEPGIRVVTTAMEWTSERGPLRAGVSSFGFGGTIAHVCLEEGDGAPEPMADSAGPRVLVLSEASLAALWESAGRLATMLADGGPGHGLDDVARTLARHRSHLEHRAAVVAVDRADATRLLSTLADQHQGPGVTTGRAASGPGVRPVWVFSGHGAQWAGMGRELLVERAEFADLCTTLDPIYRAEAGFSLIEALKEDDLTQVERVQSVLFAVQVGLARVWEAHGLRPAAVVGHSMGEIAAAVVAGVWSVEDGARFACRRALALRAAAGRGAMVMVDVPFDELRTLVLGRPNLAAAIEPAPGWSVLSGDAAEVAELADELTAQRRTVRRIASDVAFHSPHMDELVDDIVAAAAPLAIGAPQLPLYSTVLDDPRSDAPRGPEYWGRNLREPVRFAAALSAALDDGHRLFLELSPHPIVTHNIGQLAEHRGLAGVSTAHSLRRNRPELMELLGQLAVLHCAGTRFDWDVVLPGRGTVALPARAWQHHDYWLPTATVHEVGHDPASHTLLGARTAVSTTPPTTLWQSRLTPETRPYDTPHTVHGADIVPASVLINTLVAAVSPDMADPHRLGEISLLTPLPTGQSREVQLVAQDNRLTLSSRPTGSRADSRWIVHTTAHDLGVSDLRVEDVSVAVPDAMADGPSAQDVLDELAPLGVTGIAFPWDIRKLHQDERTVTAVLSVPDSTPTWAQVLDAATTLTAFLLARQGIRRMPTAIESVDLTGAPPPEMVMYAALRPGRDDILDLDLRSVDGTAAARAIGLRFGIVDDSQVLSSNPRKLLHELRWQPLAEQEPAADQHPTVTLVAPASSDLVDRVARHFTAAGLPCGIVRSPAEITAPGRPTPQHVIVFPDATDTDGIDALEEQTVANVMSLVRCAQAVLRTGTAPTRLWTLTGHARDCAPTPALAQRPLWGVARVIATEHPELSCRAVDLGDSSDENLDRLLDLVRQPPADDWLAVQDGTVLTARLVANPAQNAAAPPRLQPGATYLITGALGALGLESARYLAACGARRLVLSGRRGLPERAAWPTVTDPGTRHAIDVVEELERLGVTVKPLALDITDPVAARVLVDTDVLGLPPIRGVVHAAGALHGRLVEDLDETTVRQTLAAKVRGALVLHELFPPGSLDSMVLFSSIAPLVALPGGSAYAAANGFLDGLAAHRRRLGTDTTAIAWTVWRDTGMGRGPTNDLSRTKGFGDITVPEALQVWDHLAAADSAYTVVVRPTPGAAGGRPDPLLELLADTADDLAGTTAQAADRPLLRDLPAAEILGAALDEVRQHVAVETGLSVDRVEPDRPFADLGLDSVMAIIIRSRLQQATGVDIPISILWTHPTPTELAGYLHTQLTAPAVPVEQ